MTSRTQNFLVDPERVKLCQNYLSQAIRLFKEAEAPGLTTFERGLIVQRVNEVLDKMMAAAGLAENIER